MIVVPAEISRPLAEAAQNHEGGEVVVRGATGSGRVYLFKNQIAWATCSSVPQRLSDVLEREANVKRSDLRDVLKSCQETKQQFGETLVEWGLVDSKMLRRCLRLHNAAHLAGLTRLTAPLRALFVPLARKYEERFLFSLADLDARLMTEAEARLTQGTHVFEQAMASVGTLQAAAATSAPATSTPATADWAPRLASVFADIPSCTALAAIDTHAPCLLGVAPTDALPIDERTALVETVVDVVHASSLQRLESAYEVAGLTATPWARTSILIRDQAALILRRSRLRAGVIYVVFCQDFSNLGLVLSLTGPRLDRLEDIHEHAL